MQHLCSENYPGKENPQKILLRKLSGITFCHTLTLVPSENYPGSNWHNKNQAKMNRFLKFRSIPSNMTIKTMKNKGNTAKQNADFLLFTHKTKGF